MTRATFDARFHKSEAVGFHSDGHTLVVQVINQQAVAGLKGRFQPLVQRTLADTAAYLREQEGLDLPDPIAVHFTTSRDESVTPCAPITATSSVG